MAKKRGNIELIKVKQVDLYEIADQNFSIRCGATIDPSARAKQYERYGYSGTMYYSETQNMKKAENKLLENYTFLHNIYERSGVDSEPGYIYIIKGKRFD